MDGLMTICHDALKSRHDGSHWPKHGAPLLYSTREFVFDLSSELSSLISQLSANKKTPDLHRGFFC